MGVNGIAAAQTLLGFRNIQHGMCLHYVWQAYKAHGARADGTWPTAYSAWIDTPGKHEGDRNPPAGVPVWFGPKASSSAGDVVISLGNGRVAATDYPNYGVVGSCTIDERQRQIGRPYLGWTETILGAAIDFAGGGEPANVGGGQRTAGSNGCRRRVGAPSTSAPEGEFLKAGTVGNFTGWIHGENVSGNDVWYRGISGDWFWSGGFVEGANGTGLADLNPATPPATTSSQRVTGPNGCRRRIGTPRTSAPEGEALAPATVGNFRGWVNGEVVEGIGVWFVGISGDYFWAGGFTSQSTDGLTDLNTATPPVVVPPVVTPPVTPDQDNPRGLPVLPRVYPLARFALDAPMGKGASRLTKGIPPLPVPAVGIDRFIIHHTATTVDQLDWFSYENARSVCPTWYLRTSGDMIELIRPGLKPAATGADWNYRSVAVETQNNTAGPEWRVTDAQLESLAEAIAWLASYDGKTLDGTPVRFKIDREHVIGHREAVATECPGPYLWGKLDAIVSRAREIYAEKYTPELPPEPSVELPEPWRSRLEAIVADLNGLLGR